jgi:glucan 1,3-beta-glucosidase
MSSSSIVALALMLAGVGPQLTQTPMQAGSTSALDRLAAVKSGAAPMNGVNLGSWLVLEKWMAPSPWDALGSDAWGERQLMLAAAQQGRTAQVRQAIIAHRDSWVTKEDFITMEAAGINAVRLPIGFWVVANTADEAASFVEGGLAYVDKAMQWGAAHGIGVLIDMHAAPGSQNGFDHSAPAQKNKALWDSPDQPSPSYPAQTLAVIAALAQRYATAPALLGFAPLNEPTVRPQLMVTHTHRWLQFV